MSTLPLHRASDFYQRHENKIIAVVVVLLSIYLLSFAAKITWQFVGQNDASPTTTSKNVPVVATAPNSQSTRPNINKVLQLNLFGDAAAKPTVEPVAETTNAPETKLNLVLAGVVASSQSDLGAAIIAYRNQQNTYGIGDKIEGTNVTLDRIYADRVIIKNRLTKETLMLDGIDFEEANERRLNAAQVNANSRQAEPVGPRPTRPNPKALQDARAKLAESPDSFAEMISLSPHRIENELIGYRVSPGSNPSLFNSVGLKNGDIVVELNGLDLADLQQSLEALTELKQADSLQLEILRAGEFVSLEFDIQGSADDE
ncbi:MAG: type II secretion system protein GspC [Glaciecola sp.]